MTTPANGGAAQAATTGTQQTAQAASAQQTSETQQGATQTGQEPGAETQQGAESATAWLESITDPEVKAKVEAQIRDAAEARREAARYRTERNALTEQVTAAQRANETAEQTAQREQAEREQREQALIQENRDLKAAGAIRAALAEARPINPATVEALVKGQLQYGEDGTPTNLPQTLQALQKSDPYLFQRTDAGGGDGGGQEGTPGGGTTMNDFIRGRRAATTR